MTSRSPNPSLFDVVEPVTLDVGGPMTVELTQLPHVVISTVRLSIDHGHGGTPKWYETMVFPHNGAEITGWLELDADRYTTEEQAREGHKVIVERWRSRSSVEPVWMDDDA